MLSPTSAPAPTVCASCPLEAAPRKVTSAGPMIRVAPVVLCRAVAMDYSFNRKPSPLGARHPVDSIETVEPDAEPHPAGSLHRAAVEVDIMHRIKGFPVIEPQLGIFLLGLNEPRMRVRQVVPYHPRIEARHPTAAPERVDGPVRRVRPIASAQQLGRDELECRRNDHFLRWNALQLAAVI